MLLAFPVIPVYGSTMGVPRQAARDVHTQVSSTGHSFQDLAMEFIQTLNRSLGGRHPYHLTLQGIKLHVPSGLPARQSVKIILQYSMTITALHG